MPSLFDESWQVVAPNFEEVFGKTLTYRTVEGVEFSITASVVQYKTEAQIEHANIVSSWLWHIFVVKTSVFAEHELPMPRKGDTILETLEDDTVNRYEVMSPIKTRTYLPVDTEAFQVEIYTKFVGTE